MGRDDSTGAGGKIGSAASGIVRIAIVRIT
jgi:hypothetical protein